MERIMVGERAIEMSSPHVFTNVRVRIDKKVRVNMALDQQTFDLLFELSAKCRTKPTTLSKQLVYALVRNPDMIKYIQDRYEVPENDRLIPYRGDGAEVTAYISPSDAPRVQRPMNRRR